MGLQQKQKRLISSILVCDLPPLGPVTGCCQVLPTEGNQGGKHHPTVPPHPRPLPTDRTGLGDVGQRTLGVELAAAATMAADIHTSCPNILKNTEMISRLKHNALLFRKKQNVESQ